MNHFDTTLASIPPISNGSGRFYQRLQDGAGTAQKISGRLKAGRIYCIVTGATACRVEFRGDDTLVAGSTVSTSTSFRIPPNTVYPFLAYETEPSDVAGQYKFGSTVVYVAGDGAAAYEVFIYQAGR